MIDLPRTDERIFSEKATIDGDDSTAEYGECFQLANSDAYLSASEISLGNLGITSHVMDRVFYRLEIQKYNAKILKRRL